MTPRPALAGDAEAMAAVHVAALDSPWSAQEIAGLMNDSGSYAQLVEVANEVAGFILCRAVAGEAEILTLAVRPTHRRRGVARALVDAAASAPGVRTVFLEVAADNAAAIALYAGAGFAQVGSRLGYYARHGVPAADALVLRRDLNR
jgi:ribosomal-protein-alanine N-acetyltransferase